MTYGIPSRAMAFSLLVGMLSRFYLRLASPGPDHRLFRPHTLDIRDPST